MPTPLLAACLLTAALTAAQEPEFVAGDPAVLQCRVVDVDPVAAEPKASTRCGARLVVEVTNGGACSAEPVAFEIAARKDRRGDAVPAHVVRRFPGRVYGRAGRALAPGAKLRYEILTPFDLQPQSKPTARAVAASFFRGEGVASLDVAVGPPRAEQATLGNVLSATVDATRCTLRNPLPFAVDVALRVHLERPFAGVAIATARLAPSASVDHLITAIPIGPGVELSDLRVARVELADWSVLRADGAERARALVTEAFERWHRWPEPRPAFAGRYAFALRQVPDASTSGVASIDHRSAGAFEVFGDDGLRVTPDAPLGEGERRELEAALKEAFDDLRRPATAAILGRTEPFLDDLAAPARVGFAKHGWDWRLAAGEIDRPQSMTIADATVVETGWSDSDSKCVWHTRPFGTGWVVAADDDGTYSRRFEFEAIGGLAVPVRFERTRTFPRVSWQRVELALDGVARAGDAAAQPVLDPSEAAAAVRAAWDACYRHPARAVTLRADVACEDRGRTEQGWLGERKVSGTAVIHGFTGRSYERADVTLAQRFDAPKAAQLEFMVMDRVRIWTARDFAARPPFERAFDGATFRTGAGGRIEIENGPYRAVTIESGRIASVELGGGGVRSFDYARVGAHDAVTRIRTGTEVVEAKLEAVGDWVVPRELRFERVFGAEWGPETVKLAKLRVE